MKIKSPPRHYVNNRDFYEALINYIEKVKVSNDVPILPDYIGLCIIKICERLSTKPNFIGYTYRDDMVADGVENCISAVKGFNPEKSENPFAYFTQIAWNAFLRRIAKEKKQTYLKHKNMQNLFIHEDFGQLQMQSNELSDEIIKSFEEKQLTKISKPVIMVGVEKFIGIENEELTLDTPNN